MYFFFLTQKFMETIFKTFDSELILMLIFANPL